MREKLKQYYEREYNFTVNSLNKGIYSNNEVIDSAEIRCLGAADFAQVLGIPYSYIEEEFNAIKERLEALR